MDKVDIKAIRVRLAAATPGPWHTVDVRCDVHRRGPAPRRRNGACGWVWDTREPAGVPTGCAEVCQEDAQELKSAENRTMRRKPRHTETLAPSVRAQLGQLLTIDSVRGLARAWGVSRGVIRRAVDGVGVTPMTRRYLAGRVRGAVRALDGRGAEADVTVAAVRRQIEAVREAAIAELPAELRAEVGRE